MYMRPHHKISLVCDPLRVGVWIGTGSLQDPDNTSSIDVVLRSVSCVHQVLLRIRRQRISPRNSILLHRRSRSDVVGLFPVGFHVLPNRLRSPSVLSQKDRKGRHRRTAAPGDIFKRTVAAQEALPDGIRFRVCPWPGVSTTPNAKDEHMSCDNYWLVLEAFLFFGGDKIEGCHGMAALHDKQTIGPISDYNRASLSSLESKGNGRGAQKTQGQGNKRESNG
ncbi:integrase [Anopheles sinensis]|uniref:Integrase n=1 Tax=Anopheles sinensis TaxID=74873 RepID=A0A084WC51_ANOSI|nr:integrase [Anopheles sinensis]